MIRRIRLKSGLSAPASSRRLVRLALLVAAVFFLTGCGRSGQLSSEYGRRVGQQGATSVNGTGVLRRMFRASGARVRSSTRLGRIVEGADVVVWIPDRYTPPAKKTRAFFEDWLGDQPGRTLIYVGRDYDATTPYWEYMADSSLKGGEVDPEQQLESRKKLAKSRIAEATTRAVYEPTSDCDWFATDRTQAAKKVGELTGSLKKGVNGKAANIVLQTRMLPSKQVTTKTVDYRGEAIFDTLLTSPNDVGEPDVLVAEFSRSNWYTSRIILVSNGSWLLNMPLVNHEHRRLAGNLINECGNAKQVVFLESGPGEPPISSQEPNRHHGLAAFTMWPINVILMHLLALGVVFCFTVFPIFGRPRRLVEAESSDFGKHIFAIGELMSRTQDRVYADRSRKQYQQRTADASNKKMDGAGE